MTDLRRVALVALLCGHLAAWAAEVLPPALLVLAVALTVVGERVSARASCAVAGRLRRATTALSLLLALALAPGIAQGGGDAGLHASLGPLLVGIATVQTLAWHRPRDVQTGLVAAVGLLVLGASFAPDVLVGLPLLGGWVAALLGAGLAVRLRAVEGTSAVLSGPEPAPRGPLLVATALAAVLGVVAFLLVPVPEDAGLRSRLAAASSGTAASGRAQPGAYSGDRVDLRTRGPLTEVPLIEVPADSPPLWRGGAYTDWDGATWTRPAERQRAFGPLVVLAPVTGRTRTDRVEVGRRATGTVWSPGPVVEVDLPSRTAVVDALGAVQAQTAPRYRVTSAVVAPSAEQLRAARGPDLLDPQWTALPASVPQRVRELGQRLTAGAASRYDAVLAVERFLAGHARYDLESPVPGPGEDAVDRFLFVDRVGFCEQFAAAEVLLLRASGIPARFVTGLAYGVERRDGRRTFRQKDLHAWVEVFHPGLGWVASDPTPPSTQLASAPLRVRLAAALSSALRRTDSLPGGRPAVAAALLGLTALVAGGLVVRRRRRPVALVPQAALPVSVAGRPALAAFLRFDARLGARRRRPAESLGELQARLDLPPQVRAALQVVEEECYAPVPPARAGDVAQVLDGVGGPPG